jgi:hypothetical protein
MSRRISASRTSSRDDDGRELELVDGLHGGEQVLVNPGGDVADGTRVEAAPGSG